MNLSPKEQFQNKYNAIRQLHQNGMDGAAVGRLFSEAVDSVVTSVWKNSSMERIPCAAVALGGYGRCELSPHSDVDLMLLFSDEEEKKNHASSVHTFLHALWDAGFELGHSVRSLADCGEMLGLDIDSTTALFESRFICGDSSRFDALSAVLKKRSPELRKSGLDAAIIDSIDRRHAKFGNSVKLLEPNIKQSAGGLRDLHGLVWLFRNHAEASGDTSSCEAMLRQSLREKIIGDDEYEAVLESLQFLLRVRHEIHFFRRSRHDILDFSIQRSIASGLGYGGEEDLNAVEKFMSDYFLHARSVFRLNRRLCRLFRKAVPKTIGKIIPLDEIFVQKESALSLRDKSFVFSSFSHVLRAFYWCGKKSLEPGQTLQALFVLLGKNDNFFSAHDPMAPECSAVFREIISLRKGTARALMLMNDFDLLGRIIPEWNALVAFFQHSMYHFYTADAHTLITLQRAEELAEGETLLTDVYRQLPSREFLKMTLLLHDIDKPNGIEKHEERGAEAARRILDRLGYAAYADDAAFIIRHHLIMEQIAFRRNISDPATIAQFSSCFPRSGLLDILYLHTFCDLSAVNTGVWTSWKGLLLDQLFTKTKSVLDRQLQYDEAVRFQEEEHKRELSVAADRMAASVPRNDIEFHLASVNNEAYIRAFSHAEIVNHISLIGSLETAAAHIVHADTHSDVTVVTSDAAFLLSNLCGVLSANDADIFDAQVFTRTDGIVIDRFRVTDRISKGRLQESQSEKIYSDFNDVLSGKATIDRLFEKHHHRWKRRPRPLMHPNIRVDVEVVVTADHSIIDVYAPDMPGFLYSITRTISKLGLGITFAKIATRVDGIVDSFYVIEKDGLPLKDDHRIQLVKEQLLHRIDQLVNVVLSLQ